MNVTPPVSETPQGPSPDSLATGCSPAELAAIAAKNGPRVVQPVPPARLRTRVLRKDQIAGLNAHLALYEREQEDVDAVAQAAEVDASLRAAARRFGRLSNESAQRRVTGLMFGAAEAEGIKVPQGWGGQVAQTEHGTVYEFAPPESQKD